MFKHWKRYLAIAGLSVSFAVAPVAFAQDSTPEPTPIGGEPPSEIPTPGETQDDLTATLIRLAAAIASPLFLELAMSLLRILGVQGGENALKGIISGVIVIVYLAVGVFGFVPQFQSFLGLAQQFLPPLLTLLGLFFVAPKVRAFAVRNDFPVLQHAGRD